MKLKLSQKIQIAIIGVCVLSSLILIGVFLSGGGKKEEKTEPAAHVSGSTEPIASHTEKIVEKEVEKVITGEILAEGLRDMGILVTEEYYFTEVVDYAKSKRFFGTRFNWPGSESSFLMSYDGEITAGVNFEGITVTKDELAKTVTIIVPRAELFQTDIDLDSFQQYMEKESWINQLSNEDYNEALKQLKENAQNRAIERGILERANENAKKLIHNFVTGLVDPAEYSVTVSVRKN